MKVIKAPEPLFITGTGIFLAGSIEMGKAELWQDKVAKALDRYRGTILNPRRDDWDSSWKQDSKNPKFRQQVEWELFALEQADVIAMYFDPNTQSPISMLELGLHAKSGKLLVCCPKGFWKKGNVDVVCEYYGVKMFDTLEELIADLKWRCDRKYPDED